MNSVKNAIVTMTLLAVGYGAYVVINNPAPDETQMAGEAWEPEVSIPADEAIDGTNQVSLNPAAFPGDDDDSEWANEPAPLPEMNAQPDAFGSFDTPPELQAPQLSDVSTDAEEARDYDDDSSYYAAEAGVEPVGDDYAPADDSYADENYTDDASAGDYPTTSAEVLPYGTGGAPTDESGFATSWASVQTDLRSREFGNALLSLSAWYDEPMLAADQKLRLQNLLDELAGTVIYSGESFLEQPHIVQEGETLAAISQQYNVPAIFLARVNGIDQVEPGMSLKVLRGPFRAEVNSESGFITLFLGRYYAGRFPMRFGPDMPEELTDFQVVAIQLGREYFDRRTGERIGRDHPDNPYGSRWIGLRGDRITSAHNVGIHVDTGASERGCVGVSEQDADDLSAILSIGSRITVLR